MRQIRLMVKPRALYLLFIFLISLQLGGCKIFWGNSAPAVEQAGPYQFITEDLTIAYSDVIPPDIQATVYVPSLDGLNPAAGPFDLQIVLPGFNSTQADYAYYSEHLASHGSLVIGITYAGAVFSIDSQQDKKAEQVSTVIDYALANYSHLINATKIGVVGHSLGGKIAFYAASQDARIGLISTLDPSNAGGAPCFILPATCAAYPVAPNPARGDVGLIGFLQAPSLILRSQPDFASNPDEEFNASYFFYGSDGAGLNAVPAPALYYDLGAVRHTDYMPAELATGVPQLSRRTIAAWIQQHFYGYDMSDYLTGSYVDQAITEGLIERIEER